MPLQEVLADRSGFGLAVAVASVGHVASAVLTTVHRQLLNDFGWNIGVIPLVQSCLDRGDSEPSQLARSYTCK